MSYVTLQIEEEKIQKLLNFYYNFMKKANAKPQAFKSLEEFKNSATYHELPEEEKEELKQYEGKKIIILFFDDNEQAIKFLEQAQSKGLISKEQAETAIAHFTDANQSTYRPGM